MHKMNLKSLITQIRGVSYQKGDAISVCENGYIPLLRANNIQDGDLIESGLLFIPNKLVDEKQIIKKGDIIIAASSGSINIVGKAGFSKRDTNFTFGAFCKLIRPNTKKVYPEYLNYFFQSQEYRAKISSLAQGANINNLKNENIDCLEVLIPPLAEQQRIATILDKADALRQKNKQLLAAYDKLLQSVFLDMFGDPVTNPKRWEKIPFSKCGRFISGGTPSKKNKSYWNGNFPWVSPKDMKTPIIYDSEDHISEGVFKETSLKKIAKNNVLIVVRGMILTHSFPVAINNVEIAINQDMKAIELKNNINNVYLLYCLKLLRRQIIDLISSAGHGTKKFDSVAFERLFIPIPDGKIQNQFAQIVENIESQKALVKQSIQESEDLFNGLVQKAFKGELV
jgi:type I restriction enzyme, S subunit